MNDPIDPESPASDNVCNATSELNNLLHIISTTSALMEKAGATADETERYLAALRTSIDRAEKVAAELAVNAGGTRDKTAVRSDLTGLGHGSSAQSGPKKPSILLVDDEQMALTLVKRVLNDAGFEVTTAQSGFECLDAFRRQPHAFDMVLLDLTMPFMDGEETFNRLREIRADVTVVLCTGFIQQERLDRLMTSGMAAFMRKPIAPDDIIAFVRSTLASLRYSGGQAPHRVPVAI